MKRIVVLLLSLLIFGGIVEGKTQISLLTSTASNKAIYTVWGHSAIRVVTEDYDKTYNYGVFSFGEDFLYNFVTGQTDYKVDCDENFLISIQSAVRKNVYLYEQILNLTEEEASEIAKNLETNSLPENCYYRYNFFYDNCATRPRKMIERSVANIEYPQFNNKKTYRDITRELTKDLPWFTIGIDLCLGKPTDNIVSDSLMMFLPLELHKAIGKATRTDSIGNKVPLISKEYTRVIPEEEENTSQGISPTLVLFIVTTAIAAIILLGYKRWNQRIWDILLFAIYGIVGCLIFFLTFFSEHPCVTPNFNLLWVNPLQLIFAILVPFKGFKPYGLIYQKFNLAALILALLIGILGIQEYNITFYPLILLLSLQTISYLQRRGENKVGKGTF